MQEGLLNLTLRIDAVVQLGVQTESPFPGLHEPLVHRGVGGGSVPHLLVHKHQSVFCHYIVVARMPDRMVSVGHVVLLDLVVGIGHRLVQQSTSDCEQVEALLKSRLVMHRLERGVVLALEEGVLREPRLVVAHLTELFLLLLVLNRGVLETLFHAKLRTSPVVVPLGDTLQLLLLLESLLHHGIEASHLRLWSHVSAHDDAGGLARDFVHILVNHAGLCLDSARDKAVSDLVGTGQKRQVDLSHPAVLAFLHVVRAEGSHQFELREQVRDFGLDQNVRQHVQILLASQDDLTSGDLLKLLVLVEELLSWETDELE